METKQSNKKMKYQSAVMYLVIAFSFCLFLLLRIITGSSERKIENDQVILLNGMWQIQCEEQSISSQLPGPFVPEKGKAIRYSIMLDEEEEGDSIMLRSVHQSIRISVDGIVLKEYDAQKETLFGKYPYKNWMIVRLPRNWHGKKLTIEEAPYYSKYSEPLKQVYAGYQASLVFMIVCQSIPIIFFSSSIILAAICLLVFSLVFVKKYIMYQVRWLSIFSIIMCTWMIMVSEWCQMIWGFIPMLSNVVYIVFALVPIAGIRFLLLYRNFYKDRWMECLFWLSVINFLAVHILQITRLCDYVYSVSLTHLIILLTMLRIFHIFVVRFIKRQSIHNFRVFLAFLTISLFSCLDMIGYYTRHSDRSDAHYSKYGLFLFFIILSYYGIGDILKERELGVRQSLLEEMAYKDMLTGLPNRNAFEREVYRRREQEKASCMVIVADLNGLKKINDTKGHQKGDELLIQTGEVLKKAFPQRALLYRIGGDEFCLLIDDMKEEEKKKAASYLEKNQNHLSVAIGYCDVVPGGIDKAFEQADVNMYEKKKMMKKELYDTNE